MSPTTAAFKLHGFAKLSKVISIFVVFFLDDSNSHSICIGYKDQLGLFGVSHQALQPFDN